MVMAVRKIAVVVFIAGTLIVAAILVSLSVQNNNGNPGGEAGLNHIKIDGNIEMIDWSKRFQWPGNGTAIDPFIISGLTLVSDLDHCVDISNTDLHFRLTGCNISQDRKQISEGGYGDISVGSAVIFSNVRNAELTNCTINSNHTGIVLTGSQNISILDNSVNGFENGLLMNDSENDWIEGNSIHDQYMGINFQRTRDTYFANNTYDFNQSTSTAVVQIQGVYSATNPLITNGSNVALNYIDINTNDYIVGSAVSTGVPGKVFRVRDYDGRVAIGDNATDANIASGPATPAGSRSINLIDTNGNMRIWRFVSTAGLDPSYELIKGINPANADADGQAPIVSIATGTNTITINVAGTNFNPPLATPPGIDRTTLAGRAFPAGRIFQVNGTVANNGTFTVVSSTYNSGPQTISIVVTATIAAAGGAVGTVVFGGGAGRLDGPNPGNASAANIAGTGNVWWDSFLQESDYMVFRRRTGGGGSVTNEKVRIYPDHSEWLGASTYSDSDNALIFTAQNTAGAVNYLTLQNSVTTAPVLINAAGTDTDVSISLVPKGAGVVTAGGTRGLVAPSGTTGQQPATPVNGTIRYNTTTTLMEFRQNGVWINITAGGTVTSVSTSGGTTGLTLTTTTPTTTPSITLAGTLAATNGGTGQTVYVIGDLLYASTTTALSRLADVAVGSYLRSGGVGVAPLWSTLTLPNAATTGDILYASGTNAIGNLADVATGNALISGGVGVAPSWGKISLTTAISGILPIANGGTALSTTPTNGQLLIGNGTGYTLASITGSTGLSVTPGAGTIALANTGVTSNVAGTGIAVSGATGAVTVSLATVGTAGTYGQVTTDAYGRVTAGGTNTIALGGTGQITAAAAYNALSPMTTTGDIEYEASANTAARLAIGTTGQVLTVAAGIPSWATVGAASYSVNVGPAGTIAWTLVSGTTYTATITHNLGTQNVVVQTTDISNNQVTFADLITITSATQIIVQVSGTGSNLKTLRTVIIANGASIAAGASTPSSIIVQNNGVALTGTYTTLNLIGPLTATNAGAGVATIPDSVVTLRTVSYFATSLDSPNNADWVINALAPTVADPTNAGITIRQFSNTVEQGVGLSVPIPSGATNITFTYRGRSASATAGTLQMRYYSRAIASATPAAVSAWSAANNLTSVASPANVFFQTFTYTATLASLSLTAGNMYQFEFTRNVGVAGNLAFNWLMVELDVSFT